MFWLQMRPRKLAECQATWAASSLILLVRPGAQGKRAVIWRSLNGVPLVLWAARKPVQAINARLLPIRHLSWQALYEDSI